jgi:tmRNA-binding protein
VYRTLINVKVNFESERRRSLLKRRREIHRLLESATSVCLIHVRCFVDMVLTGLLAGLIKSQADMQTRFETRMLSIKSQTGKR